MELISIVAIAWTTVFLTCITGRTIVKTMGRWKRRGKIEKIRKRIKEENE